MARDIGYDAWRDLRYPIRHAFNEVMDPTARATRPSAKRKLTEMDRLFLELILELGGLPKPGHRSAFYRRMRDELEKRGIKRYEDYTGVRNRLRSIRKRFPHWESFVNPGDPESRLGHLAAVHRLTEFVRKKEDNAEEA